MESAHHHINREEKSYRAFLLRLWRVEAEGQRVWRFSLEDSITGERRGFAHLGKLITYIISEIIEAQNGDIS